MAPKVSTILTAVPAGSKVLGDRVLLTVRAIVEWRLEPGTAIPDWLERWPETAQRMSLSVVMEDAGSPIAKSEAEPAVVLAAGATDRLSAGFLACRQVTVNRGPLPDNRIAVGEAVTKATARVKDRWKHASEWTGPYQPIADYVKSFDSATDVGTFSERSATDPTYIYSNVTSKHPEIAKRLGLLFEREVTLPSWQVWIGKPLFIRVFTSFAEGEVIRPYTKTVLRRPGLSAPLWLPLSSRGVLTTAPYEGLLSMDGWSLVGAEYFQENLQELAVERREQDPGKDPWTKPHQETGGIAIANANIRALIERKGVQGDERTRSDPSGAQVEVLGWEELLVGIRPDFDFGAGWQSLVTRTVRYRDHDGKPLLKQPQADEGYVEVGAFYPDGRGSGWLLEEVSRWEGRSLALPKTEEFERYVADTTDRPNPNARLRWGTTCQGRARPVFKGGWGPGVEAIAGWGNPPGFFTKPLTYLREERVAAPVVRGLSDAEAKNAGIFCSNDDGLPSSRVLTILPPRVGRLGVKRSGILTGTPKRQASDLALATSLYDEPTFEGFPDPWLSLLDIQLRLFGTAPDVECTEVKGGRSLRRGEPVVVSLSWREKGRPWPSFHPIRLHVEAARRGPTGFATDGQDAIWLFVAPGDLVVVTLIGRLSPPDDSVQRIASIGPQLLSFGRVARLRGVGIDVSSAPSRAMRLVADELTLNVRHATKAPLEAPRMTAPVLAREPHERDARLIDLVRVDRQTTSDMVAAGSWHEWEFDGQKMVQRPKSFPAAPSWLLSTENPSDYGPSGESTELEPLKLLIPFADGRRRDLSVALSARPRWGSFFKGGRELAGDQVKLIAPNSMRPPPLDVGLVLPSSRVTESAAEDAGRKLWKQQLDGETCRIYLGPRWYETGPDEMLGVVCRPETFGNDAERKVLKDTFSQWGAEVLHDAPNIGPGPFARHFPKRVLTFDGVLSETGDPKRVGRPATVAAHAVEFDEHEGEYFADVRVEGHGTAYPWVRFVLTRFQPESCEGMHVSRVVSAQFAQVMPNQWITVSESYRERRLLRVAASRAPGNTSDSTLASLTAMAYVLVPAKPPTGAGTGAPLRAHAGRLWVRECSVRLLASGVQHLASGTVWHAELAVPKGLLLLEIEETLRPPGSDPSDAGLVRRRQMLLDDEETP